MFHDQMICNSEDIFKNAPYVPCVLSVIIGSQISKLVQWFEILKLNISKRKQYFLMKQQT